MTACDKKLDKIIRLVMQLSKITGLTIEICLESIGVYIIEEKKGASFEKSLQAANTFLYEKMAVATANNDRHHKEIASDQEAN